MADMTNSLKGRLVQLETEMTQINQKNEAESTYLAGEQLVAFNKLADEAEGIKAALTAQSRLVNIATSNATPAVQVATSRPAITAGSPWKTLGQYAMDVRKAKTDVNVAQRLMNAASSFSGEGTPGDGGYAVPNDLRRDIQSHLFGSPESLLSRCDVQRSFSTTMVFPRDVEQDWELGTTGSFVAEGANYPENKVGVGQVSVSAGKVGHIINATEELINDSLAFDSYLSSKGLRGLQYNINRMIISGTGANNTPTGFLAHGALKVQNSSAFAYTAGQKIAGDDLLAMYYSMPAAYRDGAVWIVSPDLEPQLVTAKFDGATLFAQAGSAMNPTDTSKIYGKPVIVNPLMKATGAVGDIAFVNLSKYLAFVKSDVQTSFTPYLYWNSDTLSWKFSVRLGGRPWFDAPVALPSGKTLSPFVALKAR